MGRSILVFRIVTALQIGVVLAGLAEAQQLEWVKPSLPSVPPARCCGAVAYDADTNSTILFGGGIDGVAFGDTWLFSQAEGWLQFSPATSPPATSGAGLAYDPTSKTAVLFGGNPGNFVYENETWTWDGSTWTQQFPTVSPSARAFNTEPMAFDGATGTVVLFGGFANGGTSFLDDTWVWDGRSRLWVERFPATSPSPRATTVAYDGASKKVVIFGGQGPGGSYLADTWTWDGTTWTQQFPTSSPSARANHMMAYDASIGQTVLFGGDSPDGGPLNDTWVWNGSTWRQIQTPFAPAARSGASMNYDPNLKGVVLFGGALANSSFTNSTWLFFSVGR